MKWKKAAAGLTVLALGAAALAGCNMGGSGVAEDSDQPVELLVSYGPTEIGMGNTTTEEIYKGFLEKHPNVTINIENAAASDPKILAMIAAGNPPNVLRMNATEDIPGLVTRNMLTPLDDYLEKSEVVDVNDFADAAKLLRFDGTSVGNGPYYGAYKDWSIETMLWINKRLFEEAGIPIPSNTEAMTYAELAEYAKALTKVENGQVVQMGFSGIPTIYDFIEGILTSEGKSIWTDDFKGTTLLTDPAVREVFEYVYDLQMANAYESDINVVDSDMNWFKAGKTAILMCGYWFQQLIQEGIDSGELNADDYLTLPSPVMNKGDRFSIITSGTSGGIMASADHQDLSYELWEYIHFGEPADQRAKKGYGLPMTNSRMELLPRDTEFQRMALDTTLDDMPYLGEMRINPYVSISSINSSFKKFYSPVLYGESTLDEALKNMDAEFVQLIQEGMEVAGVK